MMHESEFQMLAPTEVELLPKGKAVMKKHQGEASFPDKGLLLTLIISSLFCFVFFPLSLAALGLWFLVLVEIIF